MRATASAIAREDYAGTNGRVTGSVFKSTDGATTAEATARAIVDVVAAIGNAAGATATSVVGDDGVAEHDRSAGRVEDGAAKASRARVRMGARPSRGAPLVSEILLAQFRDLGVRVIAADSGTGTAPTGRPPTVRLPSPQSSVDGLSLGDA